MFLTHHIYWCYKWYPSARRHASYLTNTLITGRRNSAGGTEDANTSWMIFDRRVFGPRIITMHFTLQYSPQVKSGWQRFRRGNVEATILCLLINHQKHPLNRAQKCLQCLKNSVRTWQRCEFVLSDVDYLLTTLLCGSAVRRRLAVSAKWPTVQRR
jgi:hypothetical protein